MTKSISTTPHLINPLPIEYFLVRMFRLFVFGTKVTQILYIIPFFPLLSTQFCIFASKTSQKVSY